MGTGERSEYQVSGIRCSLVYLHTGQKLITFPYFHNTAEIQSCFHAVAHHVHSQRNQIHITRSFPISEKSPFHSVRSRKDTEFRIAYPAAPVIMGMYA